MLLAESADLPLEGGGGGGGGGVSTFAHDASVSVSGSLAVRRIGLDVSRKTPKPRKTRGRRQSPAQVPKWTPDGTTEPFESLHSNVVWLTVEKWSEVVCLLRPAGFNGHS